LCCFDPLACIGCPYLANAHCRKAKDLNPLYPQITDILSHLDSRELQHARYMKFQPAKDIVINEIRYQCLIWNLASKAKLHSSPANQILLSAFHQLSSLVDQAQSEMSVAMPSSSSSSSSSSSGEVQGTPKSDGAYLEGDEAPSSVEDRCTVRDIVACAQSMIGDDSIAVARRLFYDGQVRTYVIYVYGTIQV
jgi:hypothetical protein